MSEGAESTPPARFHRIGLALLVAILVGGAAVALLYVRHHRALARETARRQKRVDEGPLVYVAPVHVLPGVRDLTLPADVRAFFQSTVYGKVAGYVKSIRVDKGDVVHANQILGELETPEIDQQVAAAASDLEIKRRTFERYRILVAKDFVSREDFETVRAQFEVATATLRQNRALQKYKIMRAPFDGTVTARYVDPGALIPAATGATVSALPLVDIADLRRLRITVFVQQDAAPYVRAGNPVLIVDDDRPDLKIHATVTRFAKSLDPRSRSMLCEIWLDNEYRLYPGTFVHVTLHLDAPALPTVPSSSLVLRDDRTVAAVVRDSRIRFVPVETGLDDGRTVQIVSGLAAGDVVAISLPGELGDGALVRAVAEKKATPPGSVPTTSRSAPSGPASGRRPPRP